MAGLLFTISGAISAQQAVPEQQLQTLKLETSGDRARLLIASSAPLEWQLSSAADGGPVITFPGAAAGPLIRSQAYRDGPVTAIEVSRNNPGSADGIVLTIRTRNRMSPFVSQSGDTLTVELVPNRVVAATEPNENAGTAPDDLERRLAEAETQLDIANAERRLLLKETDSLRQQVQDLRTAAKSAKTEDAKSPRRADPSCAPLEESRRYLAVRVEQTETLRADLQKRLHEAEASRVAAVDESLAKTQENSGLLRRVRDLEVELEAVRAELDACAQARDPT